MPDAPALLGGSPAQLRAAAAHMRTLESGLGDVAEFVTGTALRLYGQAWRGPASVLFLDHCDHIQWVMRQCGERAHAYANICDQWADELQAAQEKYRSSLAILEQARELHDQDDPAETAEQRTQRLGSVGDIQMQGFGLMQAAMADAEAAAQDAARRFMAIAPPAFGALTETLFDPDGGIATVAALLGDTSDALMAAEHVPGLLLTTDAERLRWASRLGDTAGLAKSVRFLGPAGDAAGAIGAGLEQYAEDLHNPLLTDQHRLVRAVEDGVARGMDSKLAGDVGAGIGAGIGFALGGPIGAAFGLFAGDAIGSHFGDKHAEEQLDEQRGETGVPADRSVLPGGNGVVDPPEAPGPPPPRSRPVGMPDPAAEQAMGIRTVHVPTPAEQETARLAAEQWADAQQALREGVPEPRPAPALPDPAPPTTR